MTDVPANGARKTRHWRDLLSQDNAGVAVLGTLFLILVVGFSLLSPYFLNVNNLLSIGTNMAVIGLMAIVGTPVIIAGALDLSVAAIAGLAGVLVALLAAMGINIWLAALLAVIICGIIGGGNGLLVTRLHLNPLIVTLGTMSIITGSALVLTNGLSKPLLVPAFNWLGSGRVFGVPFPVIAMFAFATLLWWILARTKFGREVYAAGGNPEASRLMGVNVERIQLVLYIASGAVGAMAGIILAAMLGAAAPNAAGQQLLTVVAAIILGGTSLYGGRGSVWGTVFAVLILGTLNNGLTLMNVSSFWQEITRGTVLILAVAFDQIRTRAAH
ncbi:MULTISPECIES: ABC transporter permease [unclassified Roseitalea]|uniref:ABC transporter permease n=1 Tax=unclassified Roseitalea TaxID=2639107 RepID=UPI00273E286B|nr:MULTISPECIES: ABC transporter permease [unclassified Roseitalea]